MDLSDAQWQILESSLPELTRRAYNSRRPPRDQREVLNGILWILRTGAPWKDLPDPYPPYQTCHRRFQQWSRDGTIERVLHVLAQDLYERGRIDITEAFIDGTFSGAKEGVRASGRPSAGKGPRSWQFQTALVFLSPPGLRVLRRMRSRSWSKRWTNSTIARGVRQRVDCAQPAQRHAQHPRRSVPAPVKAALDDRASVRVDPEFPTPGDPLRTPCRQLPRVPAARMHRHPIETFLRCALVWTLRRQSSR
jgi:transposase